MYLFYASNYFIQRKNKNKKTFYLYFRYVDLINVMTYDLYGSWHNKIGHHSALFHRNGETGMERELNTVGVFFKEKMISNYFN